MLSLYFPIKRRLIDCEMLLISDGIWLIFGFVMVFAMVGGLVRVFGE